MKAGAHFNIPCECLHKISCQANDDATLPTSYPLVMVDVLSPILLYLCVGAFTYSSKE